VRLTTDIWVKPFAIIIYAVVFLGFVGLFLKLREGHLMKNQIQELEIARLKIVEANKRLSFLTRHPGRPSESPGI
jgi:hypothetical protein